MKNIIVILIVMAFIAPLSAQNKRAVRKITFPKSELQLKLERLRIKHFECKEETPISLFKSLRSISKKIDPTGKGVNFILTGGLSSSNRVITLSLDDIPMYDVIKYICMVADLSYKIDEYAVIIKKNMTAENSEK
jgi:hypothetical protein